MRHTLDWHTSRRVAVSERRDELDNWAGRVVGQRVTSLSFAGEEIVFAQTRSMKEKRGGRWRRARRRRLSTESQAVNTIMPGAGLVLPGGREQGLPIEPPQLHKRARRRLYYTSYYTWEVLFPPR